MKFTMPDSDLTQQLLQAVQKAGDSIMDFYDLDRKRLGVKNKSDNSPVTAADLAAHHLLVNELRRLTPGLHVVSEEDEPSVRDRLRHAQYWLMDPLDGTREFISGSGEFTVNLALIVGHFAVWGCVHAPALGQTYWGAQGAGAFKSENGLVCALHVRPGDNMNTACRVIASKSHMDTQTVDFIDRLGSTTLVQAGSSLKFCRIAEGAADIYPRLGPTCEWDTAAAQAVLEASGGFVHDMEGQPLRYSKTEVLNPFFVASRPGISWT
jgi:3'(2'), 5'-bisphosphate nucleotidase